MNIKQATIEDFETAFDFIQKLWTYNQYDRATIYQVYQNVLTDENSFAFFLIDDAGYHGFCHGDFFNTFWMSGLTCYVSSLITREEDRGKGYGTAMLDYVKDMAKEKGCKAVTLDSGLQERVHIRFIKSMDLRKVVMGLN